MKFRFIILSFLYIFKTKAGLKYNILELIYLDSTENYRNTILNPFPRIAILHPTLPTVQTRSHYALHLPRHAPKPSVPYHMGPRMQHVWKLPKKIISARWEFEPASPGLWDAALATTATDILCHACNQRNNYLLCLVLVIITNQNM